jgi:FkbM family methyltransferase
LSELFHTPVKIFDRSYKVFGYSDEGWFNILARMGKYEEFNLYNLRPLIRPDAVCLDVGANLGCMTLAMASLAPEGKILAFEPDPKTWEALKLTVKASGYSNILSYPFALGVDGARGTFIEDAQWRSSSHFVPGVGEEFMVGIDSMNLPRVDLIKIDVEGAELDVLEGAQDTLQRCKPVVVMEFNSFAFVHYRSIVPRQALDRIFAIFPRVQYFDKRVGKPMNIRDPVEFLRSNFLNGFVDDLVCTYA